jgi:hypothetical protein
MAMKAATRNGAALRLRAIQEIEEPREAYAPEIRQWSSGDSMQDLTGGEYVFLGSIEHPGEGFVARYLGQNEGSYEFVTSFEEMNPERVVGINTYALSGDGEIVEGIFAIDSTHESEGTGRFVGTDEPAHERLHRFLYGGTI